MAAGRPVRLDEIKKAQICSLLAVGCSRATAARFVGCCVKTIRNAAAADPQFQRQLEHAAAQAMVSAIDNVSASPRKSWRAAKWLLQSLERRRRAGVNPPQPKPRPTAEIDLLAEFARRIAARAHESAAK